VCAPTDLACRRGDTVVGMDSNVAEVVTEARLEECARRPVERRAGRAKRLGDEARHRSPRVPPTRAPFQAVECE
jgi:hypothetical protein